MLRCGKGIKGTLRVVDSGGLCEGEGVGGSGSGREMPERGLIFENDGDERGPLDAELPLGW